jgi:hypothetical protein
MPESGQAPVALCCQADPMHHLGPVSGEGEHLPARQGDLDRCANCREARAASTASACT